jgi:HK97 family phage major capsid protein/HK97 family phage prohead protease
MEIVTKTMAAAAPNGDPLEFIMSDGTTDRFGDVIEPKGWELGNFKKNPIALFGHDGDFPIGNWRTVRVQENRLLGRLDLMAPVSERLQELHAAVDAGVLRAVSVGFRPIKSEPIEGTRGIRFLKTELVECSLVSIPANPNALQLAKSLNLSRDTLNLIFGKSAFVDREMGRGRYGESASRTTHPIRKRNMDGNFTALIEKAQDRVVALQDQLATHLAGQEALAEDDDEGLASASTTTTELNKRLGEARLRLTSLKDSELLLGQDADEIGTVTRGTGTSMVPSRETRPAPMFRQKVKEAAPMDYFARIGAAMMVSHKHHLPLIQVLKDAYAHDFDRTLAVAGIVTRAATVPATTTLTGWAAELVATTVLDILDQLYGDPIYAALAPRGPRFTFGRSGIVSIPARSSTPTVAGAFVAEGAPIPVKQAAFTSATLRPKKMGVITAWTREIGEHSTPDIEQFLRQAIIEDTAVSLDAVLIDTNAATSVRPAGLLNGVTPISATAGGGFAAAVADLSAMVKAMAAQNALRTPVWIMNPGDVASLGLIPTSTGDFAFRDELNNGRLLGYPLISSSHMTVDNIILLDAADFFSATGDTPNFAVSDQATLHFEDTTPLQIAVVGTPNTVAAPVRSMFQTDSVALRMTLDVNWAMRRTGVVQTISGITWS